MNFSSQNPGTRLPSFLGGFAEATEEKDSSKISQRAGFKVRASSELTNMKDEVNDHPNLSLESEMSSQIPWQTRPAGDMEDYFRISLRSGFCYTALLDYTKMVVDVNVKLSFFEDVQKTS